MSAFIDSHYKYPQTQKKKHTRIWSNNVKSTFIQFSWMKAINTLLSVDSLDSISFQARYIIPRNVTSKVDSKVMRHADNTTPSSHETNNRINI